MLIVGLYMLFIACLIYEKFERKKDFIFKVCMVVKVEQNTQSKTPKTPKSKTPCNFKVTHFLKANNYQNVSNEFHSHFNIKYS